MGTHIKVVEYILPYVGIIFEITKYVIFSGSVVIISSKVVKNLDCLKGTAIDELVTWIDDITTIHRN